MIRIKQVFYLSFFFFIGYTNTVSKNDKGERSGFLFLMEKIYRDGTLSLPIKT